MTDRPLGLRTATELAEMLRRRQVSSRELLSHYLERQAKHHESLNAIITIDQGAAEAAAAEADEQLARDDAAPPLLGLPMTVKDALATAGMRSTGGATELADHVPTNDAEVVGRARSAGAVIFGKTNLPLWSADVQASNEIFGTTNNPWDVACGPGGSSGGAAAAVAAGLTSLEIGTDIGGSVRLPAHFSGVCGHKPSFGIVPQLGYISHTTYETGEPDVNVIGPLGRSVDDCELMLNVLAGPKASLSDAWKLELPESRASEPTDFRVAAHLDDAVAPVGSEVADVLAAAISAIEADGVLVNQNAWPADVPFADVNDVGLPLISAATSPSRGGTHFEEMRAIVSEPDAHSETMQMRARATAMFHRDWLMLGETRDQHRLRWANFFDHFDVMLAPVAITAAFAHMHEGNLYTRTLEIDGRERSYTDLIKWTAQFGYVGLPSTVVPVGLSPRGVPVGIQVVGPHLGDRTTLAFARYLERLLGGYQVPPGYE